MFIFLSGEPAFNGVKDFCPDHARSDMKYQTASNGDCHDEQQDNEVHVRSSITSGTNILTYARWQECDPDDTVRFYSLRMRIPSWACALASACLGSFCKKSKSVAH